MTAEYYDFAHKDLQNGTLFPHWHCLTKAHARLYCCCCCCCTNHTDFSAYSTLCKMFFSAGVTIQG